MFEIGQQVVCVDDGDDPFNPSGSWKGDAPVKGAVYTIKDMGTHVWYGHVCLGFVEIINGGEAHEGRYNARRFRPLRKTDISIFTAMLTKTPETV